MKDPRGQGLKESSEKRYSRKFEQVGIKGTDKLFRRETL